MASRYADAMPLGTVTMKYRVRLIILALVGLLLSLGLITTSSPQVQAQADEEAPAAAEISGSYTDPLERFQVGILSGFSIDTVANAPLFQNADGSLAYTVTVEPLGTDSPVSLPDAELLRTAQAVFGDGEGFQTQGFQAVDGGLEIAWRGRLSQTGPPVPIQGKILAKQQGNAIYLLMVAATETGVDQLDTAIILLSRTLAIAT